VGFLIARFVIRNQSGSGGTFTLEQTDDLRGLVPSTAAGGASGGGGAENFIDLLDVPSSYSGQGGKVVAVNSGETAVEFVSSIDLAGTLDVTGATTLDSTLDVTGAASFHTTSYVKSSSGSEVIGTMNTSYGSGLTLYLSTFGGDTTIDTWDGTSGRLPIGLNPNGGGVTVNGASLGSNALAVNGSITSAEIAAPGTPASGYGVVYWGTDSKLYAKNDAGSAHSLWAQEIGMAVSDETTALTTGTGKLTFRMPNAMTLTAVRASVTTAPTGSVLTVDINEGGSSILSTKLTIDAGEKTSTTAATPAVISDSALADDAEITIDIDTVGSTIAGTGLKVWLIGTRA